MKRRRGPSILWLIGAAALGAALAYAFWPRPLEVDVGRVDRGPMRITVDEDGKTRVRDRYVVSAPVAGRLRRITLREGDPIHAGKTVLAVIEPADPAPLDARERAQAEARVKAAEASLSKATPELERAKTAHEYAQQDLERMRDGFARKVISHQALDAAEEKELTTAQELIAARFGQQVAQFEVEQAKSALIRRAGPAATTAPSDWLLDVPAPVDGTVLRVFQESSAVVAAGTKLVEVGDPRNLEVVVDVLSSDGAAIAPGAKVTFDGWGGPHPLAGRVRRIEPSAFTKVSALGVEEQRVNVIIDLVDPPDQRPTLGDAFRVDAHITTWEETDVRKIPAGALFRQGDGWAVFVVDDGKAHLRPVKIGRQNATDAELLGGLEESATVVLFPGDKIRDGVRVVERSR